jgi:hypothetical protein
MVGRHKPKWANECFQCGPQLFSSLMCVFPCFYVTFLFTDMLRKVYLPLLIALYEYLLSCSLRKNWTSQSSIWRFCFAWSKVIRRDQNYMGFLGPNSNCLDGITANLSRANPNEHVFRHIHRIQHFYQLCVRACGCSHITFTELLPRNRCVCRAVALQRLYLLAFQFFFFLSNPILFAICTSTFSKLCVTYTLTCRRVLSSAPL